MARIGRKIHNQFHVGAGGEKGGEIGEERRIPQQGGDGDFARLRHPARHGNPADDFRLGESRPAIPAIDPLLDPFFEKTGKRVKSRPLSDQAQGKTQGSVLAVAEYVPQSHASLRRSALFARMPSGDFLREIPLPRRFSQSISHMKRSQGFAPQILAEQFIHFIRELLYIEVHAET
jgi:hypothetical protein